MSPNVGYKQTAAHRQKILDSFARRKQIMITKGYVFGEQLCIVCGQKRAGSHRNGCFPNRAKRVIARAEWWERKERMGC